MNKCITGVLVGLLVVGVGAVFAVAGRSGLGEVQPYADGVSTTAEIVGVVEGTVVIDGVARANFSPVYEFVAVDGERRRIVDHVNASRRPAQVGTAVEISYRPDEAASVRRVDVDRSWLGVFVIGGSVVAALGGVVVVASVFGGIRRTLGRA
jgi:hypothetical protein